MKEKKYNMRKHVSSTQSTHPHALICSLRRLLLLLVATSRCRRLLTPYVNVSLMSGSE